MPLHLEGSSSFNSRSSSLAESPMLPAAPRSPNPFAFGSERNRPFFAKRKRNIFKGPALAFGGGSGRSSSGGTPSQSRSVSGDRLGGGRRSGEIAAVQEEDEDALEMEDDMMAEEDEDDDDRDTVKFMGLEEEDEDIEEVENFTPVVNGPGERIEEVIFEPAEPVKAENGQVGASSGIPGIPLST